MPYSPGVSYEGYKMLYSGITSGVGALAQGIEKFAEEQKRDKELGKAAEAFAKHDPDFTRGMGHTPESFANLSAKDKVAAFHGYQQAQAQKEITSRLQYYAQKQQQMADMDAADNSLGDLSQFVGQQMMQPGTAPSNEALSRFYEADANQMPEVQRPQPTAPDFGRVVAEGLSKFAPAGRSAQFDNTLQRLIQVYGAKPKSAGLPLGQVLDLGPTGKLVGTGGAPHFVPGEGGWQLPPPDPAKVPKGVTMMPTSRGSVQYIKETPQTPEVPNVAWLYAEDPKEFAKGVQTVQDPAMRAAIIKERIGYNHAMGKTDDLASMLREALNPSKKDTANSAESSSVFDRVKSFFATGKTEAAPAAAATPKATFKKGQQAVQDGVLYEFDGAAWKPVKGQKAPPAAE